MIPVEEALLLVMENLPPRRVVEVGFQDAQGRILAGNITSSFDVPPFRRSMMDGYAVCSADVAAVPADLELVGESRAGQGFRSSLKRGQGAAIMTGAPVPQGADAVQAIEQSCLFEDRRHVTILKAVMPGENMVQIGAEASRGEMVLENGRLIGPTEIAILATLGVCHVEVFQPPRIAVIATGDELVEPALIPRTDQIRNSNAYSLQAQLRQCGISPEYLGIANDSEESLQRIIQDGLKRDMLILTGGVSVGAYDKVKTVFRDLALTVLFDKVAMRPGKPSVFARRGDKLLFGLPGNPISAFVAFENFVRPALEHLCGFSRPGLLRIRGVLTRDMKQHPGRTSFLPACAAWDGGGWKVDPLKWKGSADIFGFSRGNALVIFPGGRDRMACGESAEAMLLPDYAARLVAS